VPKHTGHSDKSFDDAAKDAAKQVQGKATFVVSRQSGEISPNPGTINKFTVELDVTPGG
jgi:flavin-binding protein dodecin